MSTRINTVDLDQLTGHASFLQNLTKQSTTIVRQTNDMPSKAEMNFYYRNPEIRKKVDDVNEKLKHQLLKIGSLINKNRTNDINKFVSNENGSIGNKFSLFQDCVDDLLENVDSS